MRPNAVIPPGTAPGTMNVIRFRVRWDDPKPANGVWKATVAPGMQLFAATARVITPFAGATALTVGTNGAQDNIFGAADITEAGAAPALVATGVGLVFTVETPIYARITGPVTAGEAEISIPFTTAA